MIFCFLCAAAAASAARWSEESSLVGGVASIEESMLAGGGVCDCVSALVLSFFWFCRWGCTGEGSYRLGGACCRWGLAAGLALGAVGVLVASAVRRMALHACVRIVPSLRVA